jgi:beta-galactosidase
LNDTAALDWKGTAEGGPKLLKGSFDLAELGDTFIDMKDFTKGYVWVNNRLLGRYWNIGPQQRLFCPGVWLKNKQN